MSILAKESFQITFCKEAQFSIDFKLNYINEEENIFHRGVLKQRKNKNDTIWSISKLILKLPPFFSTRIGEWKSAANSKLICLPTKWSRSYFILTLIEIALLRYYCRRGAYYSLPDYCLRRVETLWCFGLWFGWNWSLSTNLTHSSGVLCVG